MSTVVELEEARAASAHTTDSELIVALHDGRTLTVPISWYPRLAYGTPEERGTLEITGSGIGLHWPLLDEDISVEGLLTGRKASESARSFKRWKERLDHRRKVLASGGDPGPWVEARALPAWFHDEE